MTTTLKAQQAEPSHVPEVQIGAVSDLSMRGRRTNCRACPPKMQKTQPGSNCNVAHRHNSSREALWRRWWSAEDQKVHRRHWDDSVGRTTEVRWGQTGCEKEYNWSRSAWSNDSKQHPHKFLEYYTPIRLERHTHHQNGRPIYSDLATTGPSQSSLREVNWSSTHRYFKARSWPFLTRFRY